MKIAFRMLKTVENKDRTSLVQGRIYFFSNGSLGKCLSRPSIYQKVEIEEIQLGDRTFVAPNHDNGYTESYLQSYMDWNGYNFVYFKNWHKGRTSAVIDMEPLYYTEDVRTYILLLSHVKSINIAINVLDPDMRRDEIVELRERLIRRRNEITKS